MMEDNSTFVPPFINSSDVAGKSCYYLDRFQIFHSGPPTTQYIVNCTLNTVLAILAILGNGIVLQALRRSAALRPASRALVYSLAASDFLVGLTVQPFYVMYKTAEILDMHRFYCVTGIGFHLSANVFSAVSFLTVTAIATDRLLALHLGSKYQRTITLPRVITVIVTMWMLTGLWVFNWIWDIKLYEKFNITIVTICLVFCTSAYARLGYRLRQLRVRTASRWKDAESTTYQEEKSSSGGSKSKPRYGAYKRSVVNMFYVYILMFVCYVPYLAMFVVIQTTPITKMKVVVLSYTITLLFANSALNPFLYCWRIQEIRSEVVLILAKFYCKSN
ncbi:histamine H2 receptor-like [Stylophora pistillata]|uniref:histamine H2 receptor-like n=1 Tax=Stylophora pistillata TaxID=50429 RepID=UPI000C04E397|nr:histamine H2 receptor-like [Stylophora pistillata]